MPTPESFRRAERSLVKHLRHHTVPDVCVYLLIGWIDYAHSAYNEIHQAHDSGYDIERYLKRMCNMLWKWFTIVRTNEELRAVVGMDCSCSPEDRREPDHLYGQELSTTRLNLDPGWRVVMNCLYPEEKIDRVEVQPIDRLHRRSSAWPQSVRAYLPYGASQTLQGLGQWFRITPPVPFKLKAFQILDNTLHLIRPLAIPYFITSSILVDGAGHLSEALELLEYTKPSLDGREFSMLVRECHAYIPLMRHFIFNAINASERKVFHRNVQGELADVYQGSFLVARHATIFARKAPPKYQSPEQLSLLEMTKEVGSFQEDIMALIRELYWDCSERGEILADPYQVEALGPMAAQGRPQMAMTVRLRQELADVKTSQRCSAPTCLNSAADGRLKICSGCLTMPYCSRHCQKEAWNHTRLGHRYICPLPVEVRAWALDDSFNTTHNVENETKAALILAYLEQLTLLKLENFTSPGT
jgi:hypothetical protein